MIQLRCRRDNDVNAECSADKVATRRPPIEFVYSTMTNLRVDDQLPHPLSIQVFHLCRFSADCQYFSSPRNYSELQ